MNKVTSTTKGTGKPIKFSATLGQVEIKMAGAKLGLLIPDTYMTQVSQLIQAKTPNIYLEVVVKIKQQKIEKKKPQEKPVKRGVRRARFGKYQD